MKFRGNHIGDRPHKDRGQQSSAWAAVLIFNIWWEPIHKLLKILPDKHETWTYLLPENFDVLPQILQPR